VKLFEFSILVEADPVEVFAVISDPRSKLAWVPAIRRVELETPGPLGPGTRYLASSGAGPFEFVFQERITEWVENRRVVYGGRSPWGEFRTVVELNPESAGTQVHYRMDYSCPGGWLGGALGRAVRLFIRGPMEERAAGRLKEVVEGHLW
jgi:uncharacterized protein YndB with AHSA1/START domain